MIKVSLLTLVWLLFFQAAITLGRIMPGRCLNPKRKGMMRRLDNERFSGTWYEVERDRFTFFSWTGICNRRDFDFVSKKDKFVRMSKEETEDEDDDEHKGLEIAVEPDYELRFLVTNT